MTDFVGTPRSRRDGPVKVRGAARFAAEFPLDGMVYAALTYSTVAVGRIVELDTAAAGTAPGVVLVMTHRNAPPMRPTPVFLTDPRASGPSSLPIMQDDRVHWNGEPVALVLAATQEQADHAASLVRATYAPEPAVTALDGAPTRVPDHVVFQPSTLATGDAEAALAAAPHRVDLTFRTPRHNHNAIEPHAVTLAWRGDELFVHDASQVVVPSAFTLAQVFDLEPEQVHVTSPFVGGGFGGKMLWSHHVLAAAAARLAGRPVRITLSREGVYRIVGGRTPTVQRVAIGARSDGRFTALIHTGVSAITPHNALAEQFTFPARHLYAADTLAVAQRVADLDMVANAFMRAPGEAVGTFALECAIDELAEQAGVDPVELRLRNEPDADPTSGLPFSSRHLLAAYRAGAQRFGWARRDARPGARRDGEWLVGLGCATATYPYMRMPGGAARITLTRDQRATVEVPAHEMGMGTATTQALVSADLLGLPLDHITVRYGDSALPGMFVAGGSSQTASVGAAVIAARQALVAELLTLVGDGSPLAGLTADQVGSRDCRLHRLDAPRVGAGYGEILAHAGRDAVTVEAEAPPLAELGQWSMHSYGAVFCEVGVNAITGEIRVRRVLGSYDCGRILNPTTASSQLRGGIVMGLGLALMEETRFDERTGRIMNPSLAEYHVPVHADVPEIDVIWTDVPDPHAPLGARGLGEIGVTGVGAAVANAVHHATGRRIRDLPITPDKVIA